MNATLRGLHQAMRQLEETRRACTFVASEPPIERQPSRNAVNNYRLEGGSCLLGFVNGAEGQN